MNNKVARYRSSKGGPKVLYLTSRLIGVGEVRCLEFAKCRNNAQRALSLGLTYVEYDSSRRVARWRKVLVRVRVQERSGG